MESVYAGNMNRSSNGKNCLSFIIPLCVRTSILPSHMVTMTDDGDGQQHREYWLKNYGMPLNNLHLSVPSDVICSRGGISVECSLL
ncbi:hypothetical protein TNCV_4868941 [Trichonephila clavipes]|nr:hypothetical protein TNCV_4868941 [Trichonephila clavipes]